MSKIFAGFARHDFGEWPDTNLRAKNAAQYLFRKTKNRLLKTAQNAKVLIT